MPAIISFFQDLIKGSGAWTMLIIALVLTLSIPPLRTNRVLSFLFWWILALLGQKFLIFYHRKKEVYKKIESQTKGMKRYFAEGVDNNHDAATFSANMAHALQVINSLRDKYTDVLKSDPLHNELSDFCEDLAAAQNPARALELTKEFITKIQNTNPLMMSVYTFFVK